MISSLSSYGGGGGAELRQKIFKKLDANGDASLGKDELLSALGKSSDSDSASSSDGLDKLFSVLDKDGNGSISQAEFNPPPPSRFDPGMAQALLSQQEGSQEPSAADMFAKVDTNGDGSVSQDELAAMLENGPGGQQSSDTVSELFSKLDSNGDGGLSVDELKAGRPPGPPPPGAADGDNDGDTDSASDVEDSDGTSKAAKRFSKLDLNGDGSISADEWAKATQQNAGSNNTSSDLSVGRIDSRMLAYFLQNMNQAA